MRAGTLRFDGIDLALYGAPRFTIRRTPDPAPPAIATHRRVSIAVTIELTAAMPATVWARARKLDAILATRREGVLAIESENGATVSWLATPGESGLGEAITHKRGRAELTFTALEAVAGDAHPGVIQVDMLDGSEPIALQRVISWSEQIRPVRPDSRSGVRSEVASSITMLARTHYADATAPLAERIEAMQTETDRIRALSGNEAHVNFGGFNRTIQFESVNAAPSEGWEWIEVQGQARYSTFPDETVAEVQLTADEEQDPTTGETRTAISGSVKAANRALAVAKVDAILTAWRTPARRVLAVKKTDTYLDGGDTPLTPEWTGMNFEIRLAEGSSSSRYTLKIDTREGSDGRHVSYSGTASASDLLTLLATVEEAAGNKHPVEVTSQLAVDYVTDDTGEPKLATASFTREYLTAGSRLRGNLSRTTEQGALGEWTTTVSGTIASDTEANARTIARGFIPVGMILRTDSERNMSGLFGNQPDGSDKAQQWVSLEFNYGWGTDHTHTAISYTDTSNPDYSRMVEERLIAGTCYAATKTIAQAQVATLIAGLGLANPTKASLVHTHERAGNAPATIDRWLSFQFSYSFDKAITGTVGHDIIEASWSIERIGMVNHQPMTEVPGTTPVKQSAMGYTIGTLSASGTCRARQQATARSWGQGKRAVVSSAGGTTGAEDPPREKMTAVNLPFSGTTVACYQFDFTYAYRFNGGLTGVWSGLSL